MIEKEYKEIISEKKYKEFLGFFKINKTVNQTNFYYADKEELLNSYGISVRVRLIGGKFFLQTKIPHKDKNCPGGLKISDETEELLSSAPEIISGEKISEITGFKIGDVKLIGSLETTRSICEWDIENMLCIDKNNYLGITDYEIEAEYISDEINSGLKIALARKGITFEKRAHGKRSRFLRAFKERLWQSMF
jgi:uncharacterized protein YjbK